MKQAPFLYSIGIHAILFAIGGLFLHMTMPLVSNSTIYVDFVGEGTNRSGSGGGGGNGSVLPPLDLPAPVTTESTATQSESREVLPDGVKADVRMTNGNSISETRQHQAMTAQPRYGYGYGTGAESGNGIGSGQGDGSGSGSGSGGGDGSGTDPFGSGFVKGQDGIYTALSAEGIEYTLLSAPNPIYPETAYDAGYTRTVLVTVRLYVDTDGSVTQVEFLDHPPDLGFREEIEKVIYRWRFAPLSYHGQPIRMHFLKTFRFER